MVDLSRKVAVVTGAGGGIGRSIAETLAGYGATVAALDIADEGAAETARLIVDTGGKAIAVPCDVSRQESVSEARETVAAKLGRTSILVNNAGFLHSAPLLDLTLDEWNAVIAVNLTGYFLCASAFGKDMLEGRDGSIVHIGSIASRFAQTRGGAYSASKAGVIGLSATIAAEWGPFGIRSNVLHPGVIRTPLTEKFYTDAELRRRREATVASRRTGVPQDIAGAAAFLASDLAAYVNGAELTVDGGFSRMAIDLLPRPGYEALDGTGTVAARAGSAIPMDKDIDVD